MAARQRRSGLSGCCGWPACAPGLSLPLHTHASLQPVAVIFRRDPSLLSFRSVPVNSPVAVGQYSTSMQGGQRFNYL